MGIRNVAATVLVALLGAGCAQPEDRINAALPVDAAIEQARLALLQTAQDQHVATDPLQAGYAMRLQTRGRECGHGLSPGPFSSGDAIREALNDRACFESRDRALRQWLELRRVGLLLAAPPLRPVPAKAPAALVAGSPIHRAEFAANAGVALVRNVAGYQTLDVGSGQSIHRGNGGEQAQGLSPNGRIFLTTRDGTTHLRAADSGDVLASLPGVPVANFHWLGNEGALFHRGPAGPARTGRLVFVDFTSGRETPLAAMATRIERVAPVVNEPRRYALVSLSRMSELELRHDATGWTAVLMSERVLPSSAFASRTVAMTADGRHLVGVQGSLQLLDLAALRASSVPLMPFRPDTVALTTDPDVLLLAGHFPDAGMRGEHYLYAVQAQTLARVDDPRLATAQVQYVPALRRMAIIEGERIDLVDGVAHAPPVAAETLLNERAAMAFALMREQALKMPAIARARLERSRALDAQASGMGATPAAAVTAGAARP